MIYSKFICDCFRIERVLEALTICHENTLLRNMNALPREQHPYVVLPTGPSRFDPIIKGFGKSDLLDVACLQLINILTIQTDDLDFRFHLRNEFMRAGLQYVLEVRLSVPTFASCFGCFRVPLTIFKLNSSVSCNLWLTDGCVNFFNTIVSVAVERRLCILNFVPVQH